MNTKIDSYSAALGLRATPGAKAVKTTDGQPTGASAAAATAAAVRIDTLRLTGDALQLHRSEQALDAGSDKTARVAQLRQAVADGSYKVNAGAVADKLLHMDWQLGAAG